MKKINLRHLFKKTTKTTNPSFAGVWPSNFERDWKIIVLLFALGLIVLSFFALQIYSSDKIGGGYLTDETTPPTETPANTAIDEKRLQTDVLLFKTRQADFQKLSSNPNKVIDPAQ